MRELVVHAQIDHLSLARRQLGHARPQAREFLALVHGFRSRVVHRTLELLLACRALQGPPTARPCQVEGDGDEPGVQLAGLAQPPQMLPGPQPGFLQDLARILPVREARPQGPEKRGGMALEELMEGLVIPRHGACDECGLVQGQGNRGTTRGGGQREREKGNRPESAQEFQVARASPYHSRPPMDGSPLLARHRALGLRLASRPEAPDHATPLFFAPPPAEYSAARAGAAMFDESDRERLLVRGKDAADFLHRLLANHVKRLAVGAGNRNALLSPKGKVLFLFECLRHAEGFQLELPPGAARPLAEALERFRFSEVVTFEEASSTSAPLTLEGGAARALLERVLGPLALPAPVGFLPLSFANQPLTLLVLGPARFRLDAGPQGVVALWDALVTAGATPCGLVVRDSLRVEAAEALFGVDIDEQVYPQEANLNDAFALDKGCYVGQEVVAKIDTYGGLNKRLCALLVEPSDPVARGTKLFRTEEGERRELGLVTSWAYSFAHDAGLALAYVKRRHQEPGTEFELGDGQARARILPPR